jgi:hypothetical protein
MQTRDHPATKSKGEERCFRAAREITLRGSWQYRLRQFGTTGVGAYRVRMLAKPGRFDAVIVLQPPSLATCHRVAVQAYEYRQAWRAQC